MVKITVTGFSNKIVFNWNILQVYLAGFNEEQRDKLCKILNFSGATRYDDICERLTHIIVGDKNCPDMKLIKTKNINCPLVNLGWLIDSLQHKQQVNEDNYLIENCLDRFETDSPVCKKVLCISNILIVGSINYF